MSYLSFNNALITIFVLLTCTKCARENSINVEMSLYITSLAPFYYIGSSNQLIDHFITILRDDNTQSV